MDNDWMLWLERASCRLDRDEEGLWLTEEGARAEEGGVAVSLLGARPPTPCALPSGPVDINIVAKCDPCLSSPCKNNGSCSQDPVERHRCACPHGYQVRGPPPPSSCWGRYALLTTLLQGQWISPLYSSPQAVFVSKPRNWWGLPSGITAKPITEDPT